MKRWTPVATAVLAIGVAGVLQAQAAGTGQQGQQLKLHATVKTTKIVDNEPTGKFGAGDQLLFSEVVTKNGNKVGRTVVTQTIVDDAQDRQMQFTIRLARGDILY